MVCSSIEGGWQRAVPARTLIQKWLYQTLAATGIVDNTGNPHRYIAHDFRLMFATESVGSGLPIHIVVKPPRAQAHFHNADLYRRLRRGA